MSDQHNLVRMATSGLSILVETKQHATLQALLFMYTSVCGLEQVVLPSPLHADLAECCRVGSVGVNLVIWHHHADHLHSNLSCGHVASCVATSMLPIGFVRL